MSTEEEHYPTYRASVLRERLKNYHEDGGEEGADFIVDVLVDIRHLCDQEDVDFGELDHRAHEQYLREIGEEGPAHK